MIAYVATMLTKKTAYPILAVALTAAACGGASEPLDPSARSEGPSGERREPSGDADPALGPNAGSVPSPEPEAESKAKPKAACDAAALNVELSRILLDDALKERVRFRCLCDGEGYPLVGNINAKGATASQFCGALREKNLL